MSTLEDTKILNKKLVKKNCELKGVVKYFFQFNEDYPTYNEIKEKFYKTENVLVNLSLIIKQIK